MHIYLLYYSHATAGTNTALLHDVADLHVMHIYLPCHSHATAGYNTALAGVGFYHSRVSPFLPDLRPV
jgi:hypothetical protein